MSFYEQISKSVVKVLLSRNKSFYIKGKIDLDLSTSRETQIIS